MSRDLVEFPFSGKFFTADLDPLHKLRFPDSRTIFYGLEFHVAIRYDNFSYLTQNNLQSLLSGIHLQNRLSWTSCQLFRYSSSSKRLLYMVSITTTGLVAKRVYEWFDIRACQRWLTSSRSDEFCTALQIAIIGKSLGEAQQPVFIYKTDIVEVMILSATSKSRNLSADLLWGSQTPWVGVGERGSPQRPNSCCERINPRLDAQRRRLCPVHIHVIFLGASIFLSPKQHHNQTNQ